MSPPLPSARRRAEVEEASAEADTQRQWRRLHSNARRVRRRSKHMVAEEKVAVERYREWRAAATHEEEEDQCAAIAREEEDWRRHTAAARAARALDLQTSAACAA
jgi:hypothetical protein